MKKFKQHELLEDLNNPLRTPRGSQHFKKELNLIGDPVIPQRKLVDLGKILARVISAGYVKSLCDRGLRQDLVDNYHRTVEQEVASLVSSFKFPNPTQVIYDYAEDSSWMRYS